MLNIRSIRNFLKITIISSIKATFTILFFCWGWPWVSYRCSSWAWSAVVVTGAVDVAAGVLLIFPPFFWCLGVKSDSGRRDSNPGSERSQPKTLTTALPSFFFLSLFINSRFFTYFFTSFFFQNKRWILIVGWYRQEYRYMTVRRSHALLHSFLFFFFSDY